MKYVSKMLPALLLSLLASLGVAVSANASTSDPVTPSPVIMDGGDIFSPAEEEHLTAAIAGYKETYDLSFVVETLSTLDGQKLEDVSLARANELGVGETGKDNGVFVLISRDDRQVRFELGSGVSSRVSDGEMNDIIAADVTPKFKNGKYASGVEVGMVTVGDEYVGGVDAPSESDYVKWNIAFGVVLFLVLLIFTANVLWGAPARYRKEDRERREMFARLQKLQKYTRYMKYTLELEDYSALPNETARFEYLKSKHPDFAATLQEHTSRETPSTKMIDREFYDDTRGFFVGFGGRSTTPWALQNYALTGRGFEQMSINEANKMIRTEKEAYQKAQAEALKRKRQEERKQQAEATKVWKSLPRKTQAALKNARTQRERLALLEGKKADSFAANYAAIASMFLSSGSSGNDSSGSSGSSSRSGGSGGGSGGSGGSGGGYSSYSGGSFDGGGGSGSW